MKRLNNEIDKLNEQIIVSNEEKKKLYSIINEMKDESQKKIQNEKYYENYIKSLNEQINQLENQIEILQNKVNEINGQDSNEKNYIFDFNSLREQIIYLQKENYRLNQALKGKDTKNNIKNFYNIKKKLNKNNPNKLQFPINDYTCYSKRSTETENEYVNQIIKEFHKQVDDLNIENKTVDNTNGNFGKTTKNTGNILNKNIIKDNNIKMEQNNLFNSNDINFIEKNDNINNKNKSKDIKDNSGEEKMKIPEDINNLKKKEKIENK